jgi:hypothetical protein
MTDPQEFRGWCVFHKNGVALAGTFVRESANWCARRFASEYGKTWTDLDQNEGYTVRPVRVRVEEGE